MKNIDMEREVWLDDVVKDLIKTSGKTDYELAQLSGMHPSWVWSFRNGKIKSPSARVMQTLYESLTGKRLFNA